ncbi:MAG: hypothetical protein NWF01_11075 [Candidatus Bathyarchaeota archaeon]|nr:hypothetical protein [Candidatus Bathyarchaeota archaeon]
MTKHLHEDALKMHLTAEDPKIEVTPETIDNSLVISTRCIPQPKPKQARMVKPKVTNKKSCLDRATACLFDLEAGNEPEKKLDIDFGLYQMEDF